MNLILDTNIILNHLRGGETADRVEQHYELFAKEGITAISVITLGEIYSIAMQRKWGHKKIEKLKILLNNLLILDIFSEDIVEKYAEIDTYSQGKHPNKSLPKGLTSRNMGKNDLWIAATAAVTGATLVTTDRDFDHLSPHFFSLEWVNITSFRS